jgi:N-acetylneuraminic acid mutarotase
VQFSTVLGAWAARRPLPLARSRHAAGVASGLLYAIGGLNNAGTALTSVVAYNPSTNLWSNRASLPAARRGWGGNGAATIGTTIYVAGGNDAAGALTRTLLAYNASTNTWSARAQMPVFSGCGGSAVIGGRLYVFSGCTRTGTGPQVAAGLLHRYNPATNTWTALRTAPAVHATPAVGVIAGRLHVVGGNNAASVATNRLDVFDPATNSWSTQASMPTARTGMTGAVVGGKFYVIGGRNTAGTPLSTVEAYDPATNSWTTRASMPTARAGLAAGVISNLVYAIGGRNATSAVATNERLAP